MKFKMMSVVSGTAACIAKCPFCVSREDICEINREAPKVNWRNFRKACNLANRSSVDTVMITSRGETTLYPDMISEYLKNMKDFEFPFIELQTNGIILETRLRSTNNKFDFLKEWYDLGLSTICISVVSDEYEKNFRHYCDDKGNYMDIRFLVGALHVYGFSVRLTCVLCKEITSTVDEIDKFINWAHDMKVEQVTLRPVNMEYQREKVGKWIKNHELSEDDKKNIQSYLDSEGTRLLDLNRLGTVYDVRGQNVMFSEPLTKYTRDTNPDNGRNLIFFPDGHIRYEWEMEGGILL